MFDFGENFDFAIDSALIGHHRDFFALEDLNRDFLLCHNVDAQLNFAESALSQVTHHSILTYLL